MMNKKNVTQKQYEEVRLKVANDSEAAKELDISPATLYNKKREWGLVGGNNVSVKEAVDQVAKPVSKEALKAMTENLTKTLNNKAPISDAPLDLSEIEIEDIPTEKEATEYENLIEKLKGELAEARLAESKVILDLQTDYDKLNEQFLKTDAEKQELEKKLNKSTAAAEYNQNLHQQNMELTRRNNQLLFNLAAINGDYRTLEERYKAISSALKVHI
ncbi:hypothetical protein [Fictibacillus fluitans]|uniref:Helix-turn-helix domain-containing protein n=1 Tax=Fictibacillus fluitans TaxID=3058422 RepID=A0ABT8HX30_9BACL|nr:hypothetical protein [Fictibacillus sp. NE201]MDN4525340.1 hypothetical protein [Fictibacillus sp. NE201]